MRAARFLLALCLLVGCAPKPGTPPSAYRVRSLPPAPKEVLAALLSLSGTPLSVSPLCAGAGTEAGDTTLGQYLSGFLAELSRQEAANAITTSVEEGKTAQGVAVYVCRVMIRHAEGEDIWSWGVEFSVRASDGTVLPETVNCLGAG